MAATRIARIRPLGRIERRRVATRTAFGRRLRPVARDRSVTEVGGWGLHLVHSAADRWGVATQASRVWFEIAGGAASRESMAA